MTFIRRLAFAPLCALCACASPQVTPKELSELRAELRAMHDANARLERRLERLETDDAVARAKTLARPAAASRPTEASLEVPELAVVKLKPKKEPAPKLATAVAIVEPDPEVLEALTEMTASRAAAKDDVPTDPDFLDAQYEQGLGALKTGNLQGGAEKLKAFAEQNPRHARADNALYFSAIGLMGIEEYDAAAATLEGLLQKYPAGDAVTDGMLKLAECRVRLNQLKSAREVYSRLVTQYPGTPAAEQAEQRLASIGK